MTKRKRFYLHDVAACIGVDPERLNSLCVDWRIHVHGWDHPFARVIGT